jgi:DNA-binding NarL/FixJ family response regulator
MATYIVRVLDRDGELRGVVSEVATGSALTFTDATGLIAALGSHTDPEPNGRVQLRPVDHGVGEPMNAGPILPGQSPKGPFETLTSSQRRVCELAMVGKSNTAIAAALFVTRATVESHLHASYRKLGISSRFELPVAFLGRVA